MRIFNINGKTYKAKEFDFNLLCDLEEQGLSLEDIDKKPMSFVRTYLSFCAGLTKELAGKEIESHVTNGGSFTDVIDVMSKEMEESGFFQALRTPEEETTDETSTESPKKNAKE